MDTKVLEYIIAIAEEKSLHKAAERFFISHPALSRHLKNLETELGVPLFTRTASGMQPTAAGLIFINDARAILHQEQALNQALSRMLHQQKHILHIMVDQPFYNRFVKEVLPGFEAKHPNYALNYTKCNSAEASNALIQGKATLGIFFSAVAQSRELTYLPMMTSAMRLYFPPDYSGKTDIEGLRSAMANGMFCATYPAGNTLRMITDQLLTVHQIYLSNMPEGNTQNCLEHVSAGGTCAVLPELFCKPTNPPKWIAGDALSPLYSVFAYSGNAALSPEVQVLMQLCIESFTL